MISPTPGKTADKPPSAANTADEPDLATSSRLYFNFTGLPLAPHGNPPTPPSAANTADKPIPDA